MPASIAKLATIVLAFSLLLLVSRAGHAETYEEALGRFAADDFSETQTAIVSFAERGHPLALRLLEALQNAQLLLDPASKKVFLKGTGTLVVDATSGQTVANPPVDLQTVRVTNRLRRVIDAALGSMTLLSPNAA